MKTNLIFVFLLALSLAACSSETQAPSSAPATAPAAATAGTSSAAPTTLSGTVEEGVRTLTLTPVGDQMKFEQTELTVATGETVHMVFNNTASSAAMQHNVVLLNDREAINRVGMAALEAASSAYVPEDATIVVATPLAQPGETVEVTFTVPNQPGEYVYICTFPGHYMMMQGTLHVVTNPNA